MIENDDYDDDVKIILILSHSLSRLTMMIMMMTYDDYYFDIVDYCFN